LDLFRHRLYPLENTCLRCLQDNEMAVIAKLRERQTAAFIAPSLNDMK
jgi:hypothetical protein